MTAGMEDRQHGKKPSMFRDIRDAIFVLAGISSAFIGLNGFLLPASFLDGGVTGISLLISRLTGIELGLLIFLINLPFIVLGMRQLSRVFAIKTLIAISVLALSLHLIHIEPLTKDPLLIAVFGGFFIGAGIGMCMRGGCVIDGTEVLALQISRNSTLSVGDFIGLFNIALFTTSALLVDVETALYSMLTYLAASKTVDFLITGIEEYFGVTIVSEQAEDIRHMIIEHLGRGVTVYKGDGGYGSNGLVEGSQRILFCVVTRLEVQRLLSEIDKIDGSAFVIQTPIADTRGGMIKRRPLH